MSLRTATAPTIAAAALLSACTVGPKYSPPMLEPRDSWSLENANVSINKDIATWWRTLNDPTLNQLVEAALEANLDLRASATRVAEARASAERIAGRQFPLADSRNSVTRQKLSENSASPAGQISSVPVYQTVYDVGFDASWELDLFGRLENARSGSVARYQAAISNQRAARISVVSEVAKNYLQLRSAHQRLAVLRQQIDSQQQANKLIALQYREGDVAQADLALVAADLAALQANEPSLQSEITNRELALHVLLGKVPTASNLLSNTTGTIPELAAIPVGTRASVLGRRPDVAAAERKLAASTADVGLATAELYPRIGISAGAGFQALDAGNLFDSGSQRWNILPFISWRIFDGGQVKADIRATEAKQERAAIEFERAVLRAIAETEQALTQYQNALETLAIRRRAVAASRTSSNFALLRHGEGAISRLQVIIANRALQAAETAKVAAHEQAAVSLVALYKSLGGGWNGQASGGPNMSEIGN